MLYVLNANSVLHERSEKEAIHLRCRLTFCFTKQNLQVSASTWNSLIRSHLSVTVFRFTQHPPRHTGLLMKPAVHASELSCFLTIALYWCIACYLSFQTHESLWKIKWQQHKWTKSLNVVCAWSLNTLILPDMCRWMERQNIIFFSNLPEGPLEWDISQRWIKKIYVLSYRHLSQVPPWTIQPGNDALTD